jgi:hypothetical protein
VNGVIGHFTDSPADPVSNYTATIDWGDGTTTGGTVTSAGDGSFNVSGAHTYSDEYELTVTVSVTDSDGTSGSAGGFVNVGEGDNGVVCGTALAPTLGVPYSGPVASFTDVYLAQVASDFSATIDWGDGSPMTSGTVAVGPSCGSNPSGPGSFEIDGAHTYTVPGTYRVAVFLSEDPPSPIQNVEIDSSATVGYIHPRGATPLHASLVPAFAMCTAPNRAHGAPLSFASCHPPGQVSSRLTIGTPDANGKSARSIGSEQLDAIVGSQSDVRFTISTSDVRQQSDLSAYGGSLEARNTLRITDHDPGDGVSATTQDIPFSVVVPCALPPPAGSGSTCSVVTTANTVVPGAVQQGKRTIWALGQVQIYDGGADNDGGTSGDNALFEVQGLFIP